MSHGPADDTCKGEQVRNHPALTTFTISPSVESVWISQVTECLPCKVPWLQAGVCRLTSGGSDYSSDSSDQCPPPLLLSTGPSHHRDTESAPSAIVTNTNHPQQAWLKIMHFGFLCIFVMLKYFFEYVKIFLLLFPIAGWAAPEPECGEQSAECGPVSLLSQ